jgi:transcriptional regulator with XRE-family HTH domain
MGIKANGEEVKRQRLLKGWSNDDLVTKSGRSLKTIESVQRGGNVLPATLREIAEALGVTIQSIMEGELPEPPKEERVRITIEIPVSFSKCDETLDAERVITAISMLLTQRHSIEMVKVVPGSLQTRPKGRVFGHTNEPTESTREACTFMLEMSREEAMELHETLFNISIGSNKYGLARYDLSDINVRRRSIDESVDLTKIASNVEIFDRVFEFPKSR